MYVVGKGKRKKIKDERRKDGRTKTETRRKS
jgi:hypothetical protein